LHDAGKVPSWKAIAIAILKNDLNLYSLGFSKRDSAVLNQIVEDARNERRDEPMNLDLFGNHR
jgi:predicted phosphoadenosine phosphosulfate sulfurtransferase